MKTIKNKLFLATAILALASCADNTYLGDQEINTQEKGRVISFGSNTPSLTRAEGAAAAGELGYSFAVYATKTVSGSPDVISNVFAQNQYGSGTNTPYWVWYNTSTAQTTMSNTANWEYVGAAGDKSIPNSGTFNLATAQTIKYWDYSASHYDFVAYKAKPVSSSAANITNLTTTGFTVSGTAAQLGNLYIADKKVVTFGDYGKEVEFTFRNAATKVRLGIYETIPGYVVKNIKFLPNNNEFTETTSNVTLTGNFNGSSSTADGTFDVTYADGSPKYAILTRNSTVTDFSSSYFAFGALTYDGTTGGLGTTSTTPTWAGGSATYQSVFPNTDNIGNMILYVNYDLYNEKSGETIHVYGAKAVVPSIYMKWNPNYAYTYLFKISDNTNGQTSTAGGTPTGLFPITFDAVTIATTDGQNVGTITTVSTPAITTYQNGSVSDDGITYATTNGAIYITVNADGTLKTLSTDNTKLYTVDAGTTEADLILTTKTKTLVEGSAADALSILTAAETSQGISFSAGTTAKFTPAAPVSPATTTTYALEYQVSAAVAAAYTEVSSPVVADISTYYERSGSDPNYTYAKTTDTAIDTSKTYYTLTTPASPAVYQYKIIVVQ